MSKFNLVACFALLVCSSATANQYNKEITASETKSDNVVSDQELAKKIRDKISSGWFSKGYDKVTVDVRDGVVTLSGSVKTESDKEKIEKEVRNLDGVKTFNSQLKVNEPSKDSEKKYPQDIASNSADAQLNKKIRDTISSGWLWDSYKGVALNTTDGVVSLTGSIKNRKDEQKLVEEIQKIQGVKSVNSNLRIENEKE